jgi:hypothetical protein
MILAALLIAGLLGAAAVGALLFRPAPLVVPPPPLTVTYEAVFVRWQPVAGSPDVDLLAVAVDSDGRERQVMRLENAGVSHNDGLFYPRAAVSPHGLLVHPRAVPPERRGGWDPFFRWEIVDLADLEAGPLVIAGIEPDTDQLALVSAAAYGPVRDEGVFWGPGERLALLWVRRLPPIDHDRQITVVDGRTGAATTIDIPDQLSVLPYWAADGSGVFVDAPSGSQVLGLDGNVVSTAESPEVVCVPWDTRNPPPEPRRYSCLAPDGSAIVDDHIRDTVFVEGEPFPREWSRFTQSQSGVSFEVEGSFAGWLEVNR